MNDGERQTYENHQVQLHHEASLYESTYVLGELEGREEGIELGRDLADKKYLKQGKEEGILITAKNMKKANIEIKTIVLVTGLSIERIERL